MSFFDERREARAEGYAEGYAEGLREGRAEMFVKLYRRGALSLEAAVKNSELPEEEFLALAREPDSQPQN